MAFGVVGVRDLSVVLASARYIGLLHRDVTAGQLAAAPEFNADVGELDVGAELRDDLLVPANVVAAVVPTTELLDIYSPGYGWVASTGRRWVTSVP
jgi:hypothetical protein